MYHASIENTVTNITNAPCMQCMVGRLGVILLSVEVIF